MTDSKRQELEIRNKVIIDTLMKKIQRMCPGAIDLIGIGGSFCNGDIYEKSDLDLVIIYNDESAKCLDECFIIGDVGFDIYTQDWSHFSGMSSYSTPYVTKLFDLDIIYLKDDDVLKKYNEARKNAELNMSNKDDINNKVREYFRKCLRSLSTIKGSNDIGVAYRELALILKNIEFILFMINSAYVKRGTKRIPEEIASLNILPDDFLPIYEKAVQSKSILEIRDNASKLISKVQSLVGDISYVDDTEKSSSNVSRVPISKKDLVGTYEEVYSNWKNKMYHAADIGSSYLSFSTMSSCQDFYDEMALNFEIPRIELLSKYNPDDLYGNATCFDEALEEWKKLYDLFGLEINYYSNMDEFVRVHNGDNLDENITIK